MIKVSDALSALKWIDGNVKTVSKDDIVSANYGITTHHITKKQIKELEKGKAIYFDDGEYAHLIILRGEIE